MVTKREEMVTNGDLDSCGSDFLGLLVKARYEDDESKRISVDNVVDECKTFYLAGHETCDILLTWAMTMIINETLRLYPPAFEMMRKVDKEVQLGKFRLAKATNNVQSVHIPFGMGARICAGYNFAPILTKIALSMILQRYAFTLSPAYVHSPIYAFTIRPQFGVQVIFQAL
ncbi:unnamed protein product [Linum tenue]|uniref:Cytochrome P450 n=1 Tax=Linum tenue TaxID=586396 RepID=A0AAV0NXW5_9ROSI|nr:unnamed protein product [Linum tenue]